MSVQPETEWLQQFFDGKPLPDTKLFQVYAKLRSLLTTTPIWPSSELTVFFLPSI